MNILKAIYKAIKKINIDAEYAISGNDISAVNTIEWLNETQPINKQDILNLVPICLAEIEAEAQAKINAKQSALTKLSALGLTEAEIKAIIG